MRLSKGHRAGRAEGKGQRARFVLLFVLCPLLSVAAASIAAQSPRTVWDGVYSDAQAKRGRELYTGKCLSCHGADLSGGEMAPPLVGIGFQSNWNGLTAGDLSERIRVSMPLGAEGSLSRQQVSDIIAAIFAAGDYPAGANELPRESDVLKTIQITPRR